jgi:hypothetical protein
MRSIAPPLGRTITAILALGVAALVASHAAAQEEEPPESLAAEPIDESLAEAQADPSSPLWVGLGATYGERSTGSRDFGAVVTVGIPLERIALAAGRSARERATQASASSQRAKDPAEPLAEVPPVRVDDAATKPELTLPVVITPEVARAAVKAALRHARLDEGDGRLDAILSSARAAALLPELRLRTARSVDESERLSPTLSEPDRVLASGGTGLWLEARLAWRLDRIAFPRETLPIERLRGARHEARARLTQRVLRALFEYQRARALEQDPTLSPDERVGAALRIVESSTALDLLTDGWFMKWQEREQAAIDARHRALPQALEPRAR